MILEQEIDMLDKREYSESVMRWKVFFCQWISEAMNKPISFSIYCIYMYKEDCAFVHCLNISAPLHLL
jgi:hypothetical protein